MKAKLFQGKTTFHGKLAHAAEWVELSVGVIILVTCIVAAVGIVFTTDFVQLFVEAKYLQQQLSHACLIIIGVELIIMITNYSIDSVVDVLLLAVARQSIVEHMPPLENLLTVMAVGILFVIRKYLYISKIDSAQPGDADKHDADKQDSAQPAAAAQDTSAQPAAAPQDTNAQTDTEAAS